MICFTKKKKKSIWYQCRNWLHHAFEFRYQAWSSTCQLFFSLLSLICMFINEEMAGNRSIFFEVFGPFFFFYLSVLHFDNWSKWQALDRVIVEARKHGIRLILCLVDNLHAFGGKAQYVKWAWEQGVALSSSNDSFFFDPSISKYFKTYLKVAYNNLSFSSFLLKLHWHL